MKKIGLTYNYNHNYHDYNNNLNYIFYKLDKNINLINNFILYKFFSNLI